MAQKVEPGVLGPAVDRNTGGHPRRHEASRDDIGVALDVPGEIPELTEEWFAKATPMIGGRVAGATEFRGAVIKAVGRDDGRRVGFKASLRGPKMSLGSAKPKLSAAKRKQKARKAPLRKPPKRERA
jgi:hypothetical protein